MKYLDIYTRMFSLVYMNAMFSNDERTNIGAVLTNSDHDVLSMGYNQIPSKVRDTSYRQSRGEKQNWFDHAERNAIYNAAKLGIATKDSILFTNGIPCPDCTIGVIQAGISHIVVDHHWNMHNSNPEKYNRSIAMLMDAGIEVELWYDTPITKITGLRNEKFIDLNDKETFDVSV